jgi:hypothetical protein
MAMSGSRRRSTVIQIVKYSELSVQRGLSLSIYRGKGSRSEVQVPLGLTCKNKLESNPATTV